MRDVTRSRTALIAVVGLVLLATILPTSPTVVAADTRRPDIFVIMVDDHAFIPDERVLKRLPNIRNVFLKQGMRFTHIYNETPLCCPARASFFSGRHTLTHGVYSNQPSGFDHTKTISKALDAVGYHTMLIGKYLNSYDGTVVPPGIDEAFIRRRLTVPDFWSNGTLLTFRGRFFDDVVKDKAVRWLEKAPRDKPVFEFVSPWAPHKWKPVGGRCRHKDCQYLPRVMKRDVGARRCRNISNFKPPNYFIKPGRVELPADMPYWPRGWRLKKICESLLVVDRMVRQLVRAQEERSRPAYFFFMSDNGMSWGQKSFPFKHVPTSTRLPFYVRGPGVAAGGSTPQLLSIIDVPVTIAEIAGARMPWADGASFLPLLKGRTYVGDYENLELMYRLPGDTNWRGWKAIRTRKWYYIRWDSGKRQLYRYRKDPWMKDDRVRARPGKADELDRRLDRLIRKSRTHPKFD